LAIVGSKHSRVDEVGSRQTFSKKIWRKHWLRYQRAVGVAWFELVKTSTLSNGIVLRR